MDQCSSADMYIELYLKTYINTLYKNNYITIASPVFYILVYFLTMSYVVKKKIIHKNV